MTTFTVVWSDDDKCYIVCKRSNARSFAMVPKSDEIPWMHDTFRSAERIALALPDDTETRMVETPGRFETVADILYGEAWE